MKTKLRKTWTIWMIVLLGLLIVVLVSAILYQLFGNHHGFAPPCDTVVFSDFLLDGVCSQWIQILQEEYACLDHYWIDCGYSHRNNIHRFPGLVLLSNDIVLFAARHFHVRSLFVDSYQFLHGTWTFEPESFRNTNIIYQVLVFIDPLGGVFSIGRDYETLHPKDTQKQTQPEQPKQPSYTVSQGSLIISSTDPSRTLQVDSGCFLYYTLRTTPFRPNLSESRMERDTWKQKWKSNRRFKRFRILRPSWICR